MVNFISLDEVIRDIAASVKPLPHYTHENKFPDNELNVQVAEFWNNEAPQIEEERRFSVAAQSLNQALHHATNRPKWFEYNEEKGFEVENQNGVIEAEGKDILTRLTGLDVRATNNRINHINGCELNKRNPATQSIGGKADVSIFDGFLRRLEIGFDRAELVLFLNSEEVAHNLPTAVEQTAPTAKMKAGTGTSPSGDVIPGTMPPRAIGQLAIKAAWQIECKTRKQATADQVMEKLYSWMNTDEGVILVRKILNGIIWMNKKGTESTFTLTGCGRCLTKWRDSYAN